MAATTGNTIRETLVIIGSGPAGWSSATYAARAQLKPLVFEGAITEKQMIEALRSLDRQLHDAAQPLDPECATLVGRSLEQDPFTGSIINRLTGRYAHDETRKTAAELRRLRAHRPHIADDPLDKVDALLTRKEAMLARMRRHLRLKGWLQAWLYVHVPMTFALIAALSAHIVSVFFYW